MTARKGKEEECKKLDEHHVVIPETKIIRDFDIVTNHYYKNHDKKMLKEYQDFRNKCISMLELQRDLNALTNKF